VPDFAFDKIPKKNSFQSIFQKVHYIKIVYELVGHLYSLAWMQYCGGHGESVSPTFLDGGNIICYVPPLFSLRFYSWRGFKIKCDVCHILCEELFMLDVTHNHVDVEIEVGVVSLILIFL